MNGADKSSGPAGVYKPQPADPKNVTTQRINETISLFKRIDERNAGGAAKTGG